MVSSDTGKSMKEFTELLQRAEREPGIKELTKAYGRYQELLKQSEQYLFGSKTKAIISNSNTST
jgi:hypothetical protein